MMNTILKEVKEERTKIKEDFQAQLDAEKRIMELELKNELLKNKEKLKLKADEYIKNEINKHKKNL